MKAVLVSSHAAPLTGGAGVVYDELASASPGTIAVLAPSIHYQTGKPIEGADAFDAAAPYRIHRVPLLRSPDDALSGLADKLRTIRQMAATFAAVARTMRREKADVLCIGDLISLGWLVRPVQILLRRPVLLYIHGEEAAYADASQFHRWRGPALRVADRVIAVSSFTAALLQQRYGVGDERITLVPNGVDIASFRPDPAAGAALRATLGIGERPLVVSLSRLVERKGYDILIEAMKAVVAAVPDARCLIAGVGPLEPALRAQIDSLGLADHVRLLGTLSHEEAVALYSAGDVFALANRTLADGDTEGFGLVFLEANACGTPVVGGRAGGAVDAIDDGVSGYLVDSTAAAPVAEAIVRVLTDKPLRDRLAKGALARAHRSTWRHAYERFAAACQAALRSRSRHADPL